MQDLNSSDVQNHSKNIEMDDFFQCDYCKRMFSRKYNLITHILNCHINTGCSCHICHENFFSPTGLFKHLERGHNRLQKGNPECDLCGRIFTRKQNIRSHMLTIHFQSVGTKETLACPYCDKLFSAERNLKRHLRQIHNPELPLPTCDYCLRSFKGKHSLVDHIQANHSKDVANCTVCNKRYSNHRNLKRHMENYHGVKNAFKCEICPKVYLTKQSLKRHLKGCHTPTYFKQDPDNNGYVPNPADIRAKYQCDTCDKIFRDEFFLRQHIKNEHNFSIFYDYCRQYLLKQEALKPVTDTKLMYCEFCDFVANNIDELKTHSKANHDKEILLFNCHVCFKKFVSQEALNDHKRFCVPPINAHSCSYCDKLFTDISSLEFHRKIFHPTIRTPKTMELANEEMVEQDTNCAVYKCTDCSRAYYSDRSLKHHIKLKHTSDEAVECEICTKICSNKYYLASHIKIVHSNEAVSKCDYCDKYFKSKRNIRRHIEFTHLGMQRHKCLECDTLFKEKRSLRKHVRVKHPDSKVFPKCHFCNKNFESAKSCKIHLKLVHSYNLKTHPCHLCSDFFDSFEFLKDHVKNNHSAEDQIYKCDDCNAIIYGQEKFDSHNHMLHNSNVTSNKLLPHCVLCMKDFSTKKTLKRHIKKFHLQFNVDELANYGMYSKAKYIECNECLKNIHDDCNYAIYNNLKNKSESVIFTCNVCSTSFNALEFAVQKFKVYNFDSSRDKVILSDLCTAEMSEDSEEESNINSNIKQEIMNCENTAGYNMVGTVADMYIKSEPKSP